MKTSILALLKGISLGVALLAVLTLSQGVARADEVTVGGYTNGCFGAGCVPPNGSAQQTAPLLGLTFNNSVFSGTTSSGFLAIGNTGQPPGTQNVDNLGSFSLNGTTANYNGQAFNLRVTFTVPTGINGSNTTTFTATLVGSVTNTNGGVFIDFNNTPQLFTFSNANGSGSFLFNVNDASVIAGGTIALSGNITGAQSIPEPATLFLLGTGLTGVAAKMRKRRKAAKDKTDI